MHPSEAKTLAMELMRVHGLQGWRFAFDNARRRFGTCQYGAKLITLSRPLTLLNSPVQVRDTLLHEIAHALCPGNAHGRLWKAKCREIGANPARCYTETSVVSPVRKPPRYAFGCATCGWWVERRRVTSRRFICRHCRGDLQYRDRATGETFQVVADGRRRAVRSV